MGYPPARLFRKRRPAMQRAKYAHNKRRDRARALLLLTLFLFRRHAVEFLLLGVWLAVFFWLVGRYVWKLWRSSLSAFKLFARFARARVVAAFRFVSGSKFLCSAVLLSRTALLIRSNTLLFRSSVGWEEHPIANQHIPDTPVNAA